MDRPDAEDVASAAAGDVVAFERLVRAMQGRVWRYLVHLVGDAALAEDLAQEVFLRVYRKLHTLRDPNRFVSWVLVTARNAAYDEGRSKQRRPLDLVGHRDETLQRQSQDPHISLEVHDALDRLDHDLREAILLVGMIGLTYGEAAEAIGVPEGTVKSRVFRARRLLETILDLEADDAP